MVGVLLIYIHMTGQTNYNTIALPVGYHHYSSSLDHVWYFLSFVVMTLRCAGSIIFPKHKTTFWFYLVWRTAMVPLDERHTAIPAPL